MPVQKIVQPKIAAVEREVLDPLEHQVRPSNRHLLQIAAHVDLGDGHMAVAGGQDFENKRLIQLDPDILSMSRYVGELGRNDDFDRFGALAFDGPCGVKRGERSTDAALETWGLRLAAVRPLDDLRIQLAQFRSSKRTRTATQDTQVRTEAGWRCLNCVG